MPTAEAVGTADASPSGEPSRSLSWRLGGVALALLPGILTVYLAFRTGGYYAESYSGVVVLLAICLGAAAIASKRPFAGFSPPLIVAGTALVLLVVWTWFSSGWSDAPARALFESQRTALYLLTLLFFGAFLRRAGGVRLAITGMAAAILTVCIAALATRLYPDTFTVAATLSSQRLSFPLSYWNSLGLFAAIGAVLMLHLASDLRSHAVIRIVAAAGVPIAAATIYFTFSRGSVGAVVVGVVVYLLVGGSRGMVSGLLATAPATALALREAYAADLLGTAQNTTSAAAAQGHDLAASLLLACAAAAVLRLALVPLDRRLERIPPAGRRARQAFVVGAVAAVALAGGAAIALDAPDRVERAYESFTKPEASEDARTRFRAVSLAGREQHWNVALDYFRADRLTGAGAGTYETQWLRSRPGIGETSEAHSLYIEVLSELGLVGFLLIVTALAAILAGLLLRARGVRRPVYGALFAATLMWTVHAGVDWDWELPAVGLGLFALAGMALAHPTPPTGHSARLLASWPLRIAAVLACVLVAVVGVRAVIADVAVDRAVNEFEVGHCKEATGLANTALSAVGTHPKPFEILGWCYMDVGRPQAAVNAMQEAARLDPTHWRYRYGLAIARGRAGQDPRPDLRLARRLDPVGEILNTGAAAELRGIDRAARWKRIARGAVRPSN